MWPACRPPDEWSSGGTSGSTRRPGWKSHVVRSGIEPRSRTRLYFAGDLEWNNQEALTLTVMAEMLTIRLRERLREQLGGTYSVGAGARASLYPGCRVPNIHRFRQ